MSDNYKDLKRCVNQIKEKTEIVPRIAIVLGSGLNNFVNKINIESTIDYGDLDNFPVTTNKMHKGQFIFGYVNDVPIVAMNGRIHYYEGYDMSQVVMPVRIMRMLGADILFLSNAVGGINKDFNIGDFMIIKDHLSFLMPSPLVGKNIDELGTRFPDMSNVYNNELRDIVKTSAKTLGINIHEGVFIQTTGPNYETPAEINAYRMLGADAVGMSTACEAIAANHCGFRVCAISCITNMASGISSEALSDGDVTKTADKVSEKFSDLLLESIKEIKKYE